MSLLDRLLGARTDERGGQRVQASIDGVVIAESDSTVTVEGNQYFPPDAVKWEYFQENDHHTVCPWKGLASYYDVQAGEKQLRDAAWAYHAPSEAAAQIAGYVAFYKNKVKVQRV